MHKILFIHPNQKLTAMYEPVLAKHFSVDSATNGLVGLRKIRLLRPSVVVSEYSLPALSGLGLLKFLRQNQALAATPFIFFSNSLDLYKALEFGANDWITQDESSPDLMVAKIYQHLKINSALLNKQ